jgi:CheY-like chemotaxis protein
MDKDEKKQAMEQGAKLIHDMQTPLMSIQLLTKLLGEYLPPLMASYHQLLHADDGKKLLKKEDISTALISLDQLAKIENMPEQIHSLAQEVKQSSQLFWKLLEGLEEDELVSSHSHLNSIANTIRLDFNQPLDILVAEDDAIHKKIISKVLSKNHRVSIVDNGFQAVEAVKKATYDLILMDFNMPKLNGKKAVEQILKTIQYTPVIVGLTNEPLKINEKEGLIAKGFHGFVEKPLKLAELIKLVS